MAEMRQAADGTGTVRGIARWEIRDRAQRARLSIVTATHECLSQWAAGERVNGAAPLPDDAGARTLRGAVEEYAHILAALGHDARSVAELAQQALREAGADVPPALVAAVVAWGVAAAAKRP